MAGQTNGQTWKPKRLVRVCWERLVEELLPHPESGQGRRVRMDPVQGAIMEAAAKRCGQKVVVAVMAATKGPASGHQRVLGLGSQKVCKLNQLRTSTSPALELDFALVEKGY